VNKDGSLAKISNRNAEGIFSSFAYEYDQNGNRIAQIEEDGAKTSYTYDKLNRLIEVLYPEEKIRSLKQSPDTPQDGNNEGNGEEKKNETPSKGKNKGDESMSVMAANGNGNGGNGNGGGNGNNDGNGNRGDKGHKGEKGKGKGKNGKSPFTCGPDGTLSLDLDFDVADDQPDYLIEPTSKTTYAYDAVGNRLSMTTDSGEHSYAYNAINQLIAEDDKEYTYDKNGNMISRTTSEGTVDFTYNNANQLILSEFEDESYASYSYDAFGRRVYREEMSWKDLDGIGKGKEKGNNGKGKGQGELSRSFQSWKRQRQRPVQQPRQRQKDRPVQESRRKRRGPCVPQGNHVPV
jgi:YD repeat-containing protein